MADDQFLKQAYRLKSQQDTLALYEQWAESYDGAVRAHGYVTPQRCAAALRRWQTDCTAAIMDVGCGTGVSGLALHHAGFQVIDGCDLSPAMLARAHALDDVYRTLSLAASDNPFDFETGAYQVLTAMGVIADKHAPPEAISALLKKLEPGGLLVFSLNNHTLENPAYEAAAKLAADTALAEILENEDGPHMNKYNMTSRIYVMRRC